MRPEIQSLRMPKVLLLTSVVLMLSACSLFEQDDNVPAFIHISYPDLITDVTTEGDASHGITDVHIFADEDFVGSFELPATVAILKSGVTTINISGGVRNNGISTQRIIYPFYAPTIFEKELIPGTVLDITPDSTVMFRYFPNALSIFFEGFENPSNSLFTTDASNALVQIQTEEVRSGQSSTRITLSPEQDYYEANTGWEVGNIALGRIAYFEIDFKGNTPLEIGLLRLGNFPQKRFVLGLNPREEWTKVYVELTADLAQFVAGQQFRIYLESKLQPGATQAEMYIDNLRLVYPTN